MGVFEKLPYLNYHDVNLDWLVKQTKTNAKTNQALMDIFHWFQDQGLVGVVTDITENADDTVKVDYVKFPDETSDDFTVYDKTGTDNAIADALKSLSSLPSESTLLDTDLLLINRSGVAEAIAGDVVAKQSDMDNAENDISTLQGNVTTLQTTKVGTVSGNIQSLADLVTYANNMALQETCVLACNSATSSALSGASGTGILIGKKTSATGFYYTLVRGGTYIFTGQLDLSTSTVTSSTQMQPFCIFYIPGGASKTIQFDQNFSSMILFGLLDGQDNVVLLRNGSGTVTQTNLLGNKQLTLTSVDSRTYTFSTSSTSAITIIGSGIIY